MVAVYQIGAGTRRPKEAANTAAADFTAFCALCRERRPTA